MADPVFRKVDDVQMTEAEALALFRMGSSPMDEVFQCEQYGFFNSTFGYRLHAKRPKLFDVRLAPITQLVADYLVNQIQIDSDRIARVRQYRDSGGTLGPPLFVTIPDDDAPHLLIDGHHRCMVHWLDRKPGETVVQVPSLIANVEATNLIWFAKRRLS